MAIGTARGYGTEGRLRLAFECVSDSQGHTGTADEIVRYFEALPAKARAELEALAARDREYGEDVRKELATTRTSGAGGS